MKGTILFIVSVLFAATSSALAVRVTVPGDFLHIQDAIDAVNDYDTVRVRDGVYTHTRDCDLDFQGKAITLISHKGSAKCIINCSASALYPRRGLYFHSGEDANSIVDGFTIINGYVSGYDAFGGAIKCELSLSGEPSSPTIRNCIIRNNTANSDDSVAFGGGIYCESSSPTIANCTIVGNEAGDGGGIYCTTGEPNIIDCIISDNTADPENVGVMGSYGYGGGIDCTDRSAPVIDRCTIIGNSAVFGGGVNCYDPCSPGIKITNSTISNNIAGEYGGGLQMEAPNFEANYRAEITNCTISGNSAIGNGGGIESINYSAIITNCIITTNWAVDYSGGAIDCFASSPLIINCTISDNNSIYGIGGGVNCEGDLGNLIGSDPNIASCIFENNAPYAISELDAYSSNTSVTYCLFQSNPDGDYLDYETGLQIGAESINTNIAEAHGNIDGDPLFVMEGPNGVTGTWTLGPGFDWVTKRTTLTDFGASFISGELIGRHINPNIAQAYQVLITNNTDATIEVVGDLTADVQQGDTYKIIDYHLRNGSACIDAGTVISAPATDIEGAPRPVDIPGVGAEVIEVISDLDNNYIVDGNDLAIMLDNWLRDDCLSVSCQGADIAPAAGPDGTVNLLDYAALTGCWYEQQTIYDIGAYEFQM